MLYTLNLYSTACQLYVSKTGRKKEQELLCKTVNIWSSFYGKREAAFTALQLSNWNIFLRSNKKRKSMDKCKTGEFSQVLYLQMLSIPFMWISSIGKTNQKWPKNKKKLENENDCLGSMWGWLGRGLEVHSEVTAIFYV